MHLIKDPSTGAGVAFATGGADGRLCWWDFATIDEAEIDMDKTTDFELAPLKELRVGGRSLCPVAIRTVVRGGVPGGRGHNAPHVLVVDGGAGRLLRLSLMQTS